MAPPPATLGVTVMPEWFDCERVEPVLDRVQALGATAIATSPYVLEPARDGEGGREPPVDAGAGRVRPLDRALFGRHELWVSTAPAFEHDRADARDAEQRGRAAGMAALAARCPTIWEVEPVGDDFKGSTIAVPAGADDVPGLTDALEVHDKEAQTSAEKPGA